MSFVIIHWWLTIPCFFLFVCKPAIFFDCFYWFFRDRLIYSFFHNITTIDDSIISSHVCIGLSLSFFSAHTYHSTLSSSFFFLVTINRFSHRFFGIYPSVQTNDSMICVWQISTFLACLFVVVSSSSSIESIDFFRLIKSKVYISYQKYYVFRLVCREKEKEFWLWSKKKPKNQWQHQ